MVWCQVCANMCECMWECWSVDVVGGGQVRVCACVVCACVCMCCMCIWVHVLYVCMGAFTREGVRGVDEGGLMCMGV